MVNFSANMDFDRAWQMYLDTANIAGVNTHRGNIRVVAQLDDVEDYDVLLLDGFGVLNLAGTALPGMVDCIERLVGCGKRAYILTNGASASKETVVKKYNNLGYHQFDAHNIITSRDVVIHGLKGFDKRTRWAISPTSGGSDDLNINGVDFDALDNWDDCDGFVLISTLQWRDEYTLKLYDSLQCKPRPVVCANPDVTAPTEHGFTTEPGYYARRCAEIDGVEVYYYGKPDLNAYDCALERIRMDIPSIDSRRVLMVGDSPHTDILGGARANMQTALMADFGLFANRDVDKLLDAAAIYPDWLITQAR